MNTLKKKKLKIFRSMRLFYSTDFLPFCLPPFIYIIAFESELPLEPVFLSCGHCFCLHCIRLWTHQNLKCPVCRASLYMWKPTVSAVAKSLIHMVVPKEVEQRQQEIVECLT